jgi:hypothetical protein
VLEKSKSSAANPDTIPPASGHQWKRPPPATKRSKPIDQVMIQVELPPYCGSHSPLGLVAIEIIFGHIFEAFRQISQAAASAATTDDDKPLKRLRQPTLKKMLMQT